MKVSCLRIGVATVAAAAVGADAALRASAVSRQVEEVSIVSPSHASARFLHRWRPSRIVLAVFLFLFILEGRMG